MPEPLVSIIIPAYNSAAHLGETIRSALAQTWPHKEVIVVDNNSTDNSLEIAQQFVPQIKVFTELHQGASAARNKGLTEAKGEYIQFLDGDDLLHPDKIALQVAAIKDSPGVAAYGPFGNFFDGEGINDLAEESHISSDYKTGRVFLFDLWGGRDEDFRGGFVPQHSWLVPRSVIDKAGGWDTTLSVDDDGEFFCRVALATEGIKFVNGAVCYYRRHRHNKSLSAQKSGDAFRSAFNAVKLKHQHIGNDTGINPLLANQAMQILNQLYPDHRDFCAELEAFIEKLGGNSWQPYQHGMHKLLRSVFGWKTVKLLSHYKNK